ncbi:MAG: FAD-binding oxidoreductase [Candidatus Peregrinibacteria bacterium]
MAVPRSTVTCLRKRVIARKVFELTLSKPSDFTFQPGQFVLFSVPLTENPLDIQPRAYSIASTPEEEHLLFGIKLKPLGRASRFVSDVLTEGMSIGIQGPLGAFTIDPACTRDILFVATGVGSAPFRSQITHLLERQDRRRMDLLLGAFTEEDLFWMDHFGPLAKAHPNFALHPVLSQPSLAWNGHRGWVQNIVELIPDFREREVYICGNPDMVSEVKKLCLETHGIAKERVHTEGYV